jgi:nucleotide-binding universal stress UspA family protein
VVIRDGDPAGILRQVAEETGSGLVVIGTRGLGGAARLILGSVSSRMVGFATVPVVVVP